MKKGKKIAPKRMSPMLSAYVKTGIFKTEKKEKGKGKKGEKVNRKLWEDAGEDQEKKVTGETKGKGNLGEKGEKIINTAIAVVHRLWKEKGELWERIELEGVIEKEMGKTTRREIIGFLEERGIITKIKK